MHLHENTVLQGGKYRIVRFINSGGFGCTYEAIHTGLDARVAIKEFFVKDFCNRDENTMTVSVGTLSKKPLVTKLLNKFIDEAKAIYKLSHPNIVHVTDVFTENGTAYYVMDYIDGPSLSKMVKDFGPMPEGLALKYIHQVADALRFVHSTNRLHLDIKPGNIMITPEDNAILIDFGASKQYDEVSGENTSTLLGKTIGYAPMEQMNNNVKRFTPATDIYSLGATLYKLLTGETPPSPGDRAVGEELKPLPPMTSPATRMAIEKAMSINPAQRPQTIDEFLAILDGYYPTPVAAIDEDVEATVVETQNLGQIVNDINHTQLNQQRYTNEPPQPISTKNTNKKGRNTLILLILSISTIILIIATVIFIWNNNSSKHDSYKPYNYNTPTHTTSQDTIQPEVHNSEESVGDVISNQIIDTVVYEDEDEVENQDKRPVNNSNMDMADVNEAPKDIIYNTANIQQVPVFPGGEGAMYKWIAEHIQYPAAAAEEGVSGRVTVEFIVSKSGAIENARVVRGRHPALDKEALRVVQSMPNWTPGRYNGEPVKCTYVLPVTFKLQ